MTNINNEPNWAEMSLEDFVFWLLRKALFIDINNHQFKEKEVFKALKAREQAAYERGRRSVHNT